VTKTDNRLSKSNSLDFFDTSLDIDDNKVSQGARQTNCTAKEKAKQQGHEIK